jgi:hypothetical protein
LKTRSASRKAQKQIGSEEISNFKEQRAKSKGQRAKSKEQESNARGQFQASELEQPSFSTE